MPSRRADSLASARRRLASAAPPMDWWPASPLVTETNFTACAHLREQRGGTGGADIAIVRMRAERNHANGRSCARSATAGRRIKRRKRTIVTRLQTVRGGLESTMRGCARLCTNCAGKRFGRTKPIYCNSFGFNILGLTLADTGLFGSLSGCGRAGGGSFRCECTPRSALASLMVPRRRCADWVCGAGGRSRRLTWRRWILPQRERPMAGCHNGG